MSILKSRNKRPIISFGLGITEATIDAVTGNAAVKLNSVYNSNFYTITIDEVINVNGEQIDNYNFVVNSDVIGVYELQVTVTNNANLTKLKSNRLKLIVIRFRSKQTNIGYFTFY